MAASGNFKNACLMTVGFWALNTGPYCPGGLGSVLPRAIRLPCAAELLGAAVSTLGIAKACLLQRYRT